jgi:hypothetical protein
MTDTDFRQLCNTFGFAPSRALREMIDCATARAALAEREACAKFLEHGVDMAGLAGDPVMQKYTVELLLGCAAAIRARKEKT